MRRACLHCGQEFEVRDPRQHYCGLGCFAETRRRRLGFPTYPPGSVGNRHAPVHQVVAPRRAPKHS